MVIVGGSGNNWGAVLGAELAAAGMAVADCRERGAGHHGADHTTHYGRLAQGASCRSAQQLRLLTFLVFVLLVVMRFAPRGLIPEK